MSFNALILSACRRSVSLWRAAAARRRLGRTRRRGGRTMTGAVPAAETPAAAVDDGCDYGVGAVPVERDLAAGVPLRLATKAALDRGLPPRAGV